MGALRPHRRAPTAVLWEGLRHASTAHTKAGSGPTVSAGRALVELDFSRSGKPIGNAISRGTGSQSSSYGPCYDPVCETSRLVPQMRK